MFSNIKVYPELRNQGDEDASYQFFSYKGKGYHTFPHGANELARSRAARYLEYRIQ